MRRVGSALPFVGLSAVAIAFALVFGASMSPAAAQADSVWLFATLPAEDLVAQIDFETGATNEYQVAAAGRARGQHKPMGIVGAEAGAAIAFLRGTNAAAVMVPNVGQLLSLPLGAGPTDGALDPTDLNVGFVALQGENAAQFAGALGAGPKVSTQVTRPWDLALAGDFIAVAGKGGIDIVERGDFRAGRRGAPEISARESRSVACNSAGTECAATDFKGNKTIVFDPDGGAVIAEINFKKIGKRPWGVEYFNDDVLLVASNKKNRLVCVDLTSARARGAVETNAVPTGKKPTNVVKVNDQYVAVTNYSGASITVVEVTASGACSTGFTIPLSGNPFDVGVVPKL